MHIHPWSFKNFKHWVSFVYMFKCTGRSKGTLRNVGVQESSERWYYEKVTAVLLLQLLMIFLFERILTSSLMLLLLWNCWSISFWKIWRKNLVFQPYHRKGQCWGPAVPKRWDKLHLLCGKRMKYYFRPNWDRRLRVFSNVFVDLVKDTIFLQTLVLK